MQLFFNRTKLFLLQSATGERRYVGNIGADGRAPSWIAQTDTFKHGVDDGSIIDLKAKAAAEEAEVEDGEEENQTESTGQSEVPVPAGLANGTPRNKSKK